MSWIINNFYTPDEFWQVKIKNYSILFYSDKSPMSFHDMSSDLNCAQKSEYTYNIIVIKVESYAQTITPFSGHQSVSNFVFTKVPL